MLFLPCRVVHVPLNCAHPNDSAHCIVCAYCDNCNNCIAVANVFYATET